MVATPKILYHNLSGVTNLLDITVSESWNSSVAQARITCESTTIEIGDAVSFHMGFSTSHGKIFTGYVRTMERTVPEFHTVLICEDVLSRAVDYYMASDKPDEPFTRTDILSEDLVEDLLAEAGIVSYTSSVPLVMHWGTNGSKVQFNLTSAWLAAKSIADSVAWHIRADRNGQVHFTGQHQYLEGGEVATFTWDDTTNNVIHLAYQKSAEELRNRVVVYGIDNLSANASAVSPYLPAGFYKTSVIATPIITDSGQAQTVADLNLARFNRLTEGTTLQVEGDYRITPGLYVDLTNTYLGLNGLWFIYAVEHQLGSEGYVCSVTLTR